MEDAAVQDFMYLAAPIQHPCKEDNGKSCFGLSICEIEMIV